MKSTTSQKINVGTFILAWIVFIAWSVITFSKESTYIFIGDIPINTTSVLDVVIAVTSLNFVYQFLYDEERRKKTRMISTVLNLFCITYLGYTLLAG